MTINLIQHSNLSTCVRAVRTCWDSHDKGGCYPEPTDNISDSDKKLLTRVILKHKHGSTSEHLVYTFDIDGISRACLQELARHRHASPSVKSTRYTLKELKSVETFIACPYDNILYGTVEGKRTRYESKDGVKADNFLVDSGNDSIDRASVFALERLRVLLNDGISNDKAKYCLPEAYKTSLVWTINARSLQNFLSLRTSKSALWEIRNLANAIYEVLPEEHKYLFTHCVTENTDVTLSKDKYKELYEGLCD
jgi:thymidylate synthase (FAD)